jgi:hypothetical protein
MDTGQGFLLLQTTATATAFVAGVVWIMPLLSYPLKKEGSA